jgi:hypothetical protein
MCHGVATRVHRDAVVFACAREFIEFYPERTQAEILSRLISRPWLPGGRPAKQPAASRRLPGESGRPRGVRFAGHAAGEGGHA